MCTAGRADQLLPGGDCEGRGQVVPIRAAMVGKTREHEPQTVQQLRPRAEGAADAGHAGTLMQRQRRRNIENLVHAGLRRLRQAAARVGRERLEIAARAFGIEHAQRQRGFARAGDAGNADDFSQRDLDVDVFQIVNPCAPNEHMIDHGVSSQDRGRPRR